MKKWILGLGIVAACMTSSLSAFSIGREGNPVTIQGESWQKVKYDNKSSYFSAMLPGEPMSGMGNGDVYSHSEYQGTYFEIKTGMNETYTPPKTPALFLKEACGAFAKEGKVSLVKPGQSGAKYVTEIVYKTGDKILRVYASKKHLYYAMIEGKDLSLAPTFFDSIVVK